MTRTKLRLIAVAAVFQLARRLARDAAVGFFAAALFGLHPVQVEAVAWVSSISVHTGVTSSPTGRT